MTGAYVRALGIIAIVLGLGTLPLTGLQAQIDSQTLEIPQLSDDEVAAIPMPDLQFDESRANSRDFKKYYYFHRENTNFNQAFADILECDALASGLQIYAPDSEPYPGYYATQYGIGGVIGSVVGSMLADAIHGSSARRATRRVNMRNCMGFKGYQRFGLPKKLWKEFNFEEGNGRKDEEERAAALLQQAKVASGPRPTTEVLER